MKIFKFLLFILFLSPFSISAENVKTQELEYDLYRGKVIGVENTKTFTGTTRTIEQKAMVEVVNRDKKGEIIEINNFLSGNDVYDMELREGDFITMNYDGENLHFVSYDNFRPMILLTLFFIATILFIGRSKGVKALLALISTLLLIVWFMIPLILNGHNPILVSVITCTIATLITFLIISGINKKTLVATLGTVSGLVSGGLIAYVFGISARLTGFSSNEATMLMYLPSGIELDFRGLLFAGIIIGALGASMDVSISLASSLDEIKKQNPKIKAKEITKSGFNIGTDIMGTMINTLVLAYAGGFMVMFLVFNGFSVPFNQIINLDIVATEFVRAVAGSIGLLISIPATILFFVFVYFKKEVKQ